MKANPFSRFFYRQNSSPVIAADTRQPHQQNIPRAAAQPSAQPVRQPAYPPSTLKESPPADFLVEDSGHPLILADNLGIKYQGEKEKSGDFKSLVHNYLSFQKREKFEDIWALRGVSFEGYPGDVLGILGFNGAGKTTLCQTILGMMKPDMGSIQVRGEVTSLISLGTGFNQDISGRDNIILNGLMMGISRDKLDRMLPYIEEFSGLGRFLQHPIKYYSTGMKARLGFSIAAALEPEILVSDEVLSTGDLEFKERAVKRMHELVRGAKMVVVVTQDPDFVEENCTRALWLDQGKVAALGDPAEVAPAYREEASYRAKRKKKIVNIQETRSEVGQEETVKADNLGIKFKLGRDEFWALRGVNFTAQEKEILGIIGPNGAGKTTLCRTLSGLYRPDEGSVRVNGEITALLTFNLGFNEQISGYDNIYLNGMMLGLSKKKIRHLETEIIEFAELEDKIHKPVKEYSSGMKSRLGFSIAAVLQPDVFVVDEALSAGDISFKEKATARMQEMLGDAKTVILVTHSLGIVEKVCTRALWLDQGQVRFDGNPAEAVDLYRDSVKKYRRMKKLLADRTDARLKQVLEYFGSGEYVLAEELLEELLRESPHDVDLIIQYAELAEARCDWMQAKERWKEARSAAHHNGQQVPKLIKRGIKKNRERIRQ